MSFHSKVDFENGSFSVKYPKASTAPGLSASSTNLLGANVFGNVGEIWAPYAESLVLFLDASDKHRGAYAFVEPGSDSVTFAVFGMTFDEFHADFDNIVETVAYGEDRKYCMHVCDAPTAEALAAAAGPIPATRALVVMVDTGGYQDTHTGAHMLDVETLCEEVDE